MAVRVALNQSVGQTEKCQDCPPNPQPALNTFSGVKNPFFYYFLIRHFQKTGGTVQEVDQHLPFNEALELVKAS